MTESGVQHFFITAGSEDKSSFGVNVLLEKSGDFVHDFPLKGGGASMTGLGGFNFNSNGGSPLAHGYFFTVGHLTITNYDAPTNTISGTFSGTMTNIDVSNTMEVKDGTFSNIRLDHLGGFK